MSNSLIQWVSSLFGAGASASSVATALGTQMGVAPTRVGGRHRLIGAWKRRRCRIVLDGETDEMTVGMSSTCQGRSWQILWADGDRGGGLTFVGRHAALSSGDAALLEALPLTTRLHVIDVIEAGRGSIRLKDGTLTLEARPAGLSKGNAASQAAIRLDVLADLAVALGTAAARR